MDAANEPSSIDAKRTGAIGEPNFDQRANHNAPPRAPTVVELVPATVYV